MLREDLEKMNVKAIEEMMAAKGMEVPYKGGTKKEDYIDQVEQKFKDEEIITVEVGDPVDKSDVAAQEEVEQENVPEAVWVNPTGVIAALSPVSTVEEEVITDEVQSVDLKADEGAEAVEVDIDQLVFLRDRVKANFKNNPSAPAKLSLAKRLAELSKALEDAGYKE